MLAKRVIATILLSNGMIVQSKQFKLTNAIGNARTAVDFFNTWAVDELVVLNVSRNEDSKWEFLRIIEDFGDKCFVPLTAGGWIKTEQDIRDMLNAGADKIVVNTEAFLNPDFIGEAAQKFGSQCIVVSIDSNNGWVQCDRNKKHLTLSALGGAREMEGYGAGEIYLTDVNYDGMGQGYNLSLIQSISNTVSIPVIASGGCGKWEHIKEAFEIVDAASIANWFHYSEHSVYNLKKKLYENGINVRPPEFWTETKI